jgi:hypothetical protein
MGSDLLQGGFRFGSHHGMIKSLSDDKQVSSIYEGINTEMKDHAWI